MIAIHNFHLADGTLTGCGTAFEFNHWNDMGVFGEGAYLGDVLGHEPASEDDKRKALLAA